jgi:hypothetical protein
MRAETSATVTTIVSLAIHPSSWESVDLEFRERLTGSLFLPVQVWQYVYVCVRVCIDGSLQLGSNRARSSFGSGNDSPLIANEKED